MQLNDNHFTEKGELIFKKHGLKFGDDDKTSVADNFYCPQFTREVVYEKGLIFLSGEDKGQALSCIIANAKQPIKTIIFVDDSSKNTQSVSNAFINRQDINVINILYTKENKKEEEIQKSTPLQNKMIHEWNHIKKSLNDVIPQSNF